MTAGRVALALSGEVRAGLDLDAYDVDLPGAPFAGTNADGSPYPALGSGGGDAALQLHAGLATRRSWFQAEGGHRWRGGDPADEWPFALQGGLHAGERWSLALDVRGHGARGARPSPGTTAAAEPFDPARAASRLVMAGPAVRFAPARRLRLSLQAWRSLSGANVPAGWKWKLAVARVR